MQLRAFAIAIAILAAAVPAHADDHIPGHDVDRPTDGLVIGSALGVGFALSLIPMREHAPWEHELLGDADASVHDQFSRRAAKLSDAMIAATVAAPVFYLTGTTIEDADGDRLLIYGEALAIDIALFEGVKHIVQRPRPYTYSTDPEVVRYTKAQGDDAYQSFYSGHSATAFCAATAGAYLAAASTDNKGVRAITWGAGFAAATATANLRIRAGKHFYSDVIVGSVIGIAIGYAVPALHASGTPYVPSSSDVLAAGAGILSGVLISEVLPLEQRPLADVVAHHHVHLGPIALGKGTGMGLGVGGTL